MKRIGFILLILLMNTCLYAQDSQEYYVGTWRWESGNNELIVKLKLYNYHSEWVPNVQYTMIVGAYSYKNNGAVLVDFLGELENNYSSWIKYPIAIWDMNEIGIRDYSLKNGYGSLKYINGSSTIEHISSNPDKIKWILVDDAHSGDIVVDPKLIEPQGISLPKEIVLTKVE